MLFLKKKKPVAPMPAQPQFVPTELVQRLAGQGLSEPEIINQLRSQGFSPSQIDSALSQALKTAVAPQQIQLPQQPQLGAPPERIVAGPAVRSVLEPLTLPSAPNYTEQQPEFTFEETPQEFAETPEMPKETGPEITLEEIIEGVVAERWGAFEERLNHFDEVDRAFQQQLEELRKQLDSVRSAVKQSEQTFIEKLEEFGGHVGGIEARIGSIEKAFKDFLPELTDNVRSMAEIVERMKKEEKKK